MVLFGAGNLAVHMGKALFDAGYKICQVYSRSMESASDLANKLDAQPITDPEAYDKTADAIIFMLNDSGLIEILKKIGPIEGQLVIHTSGSTSIEIFKDIATNYGVIYPLQTFSKFRPVFFGEVPLFVEANSQKNLTGILSVARALSVKVYPADSTHRMKIHIAAIFASNFVNQFYEIANRLIKTTGYDFEVLKPIIMETARKVVETDDPKISQTGPAVRKNLNIIQNHIQLLNKTPDLQNLYTFVTNSILQTHFNEKLL
jgi:predicted short-subunit dehydrogenase-like oxidoreductase (DUF2520 family)